ncbi:MAG: hypothetical protein AB1Y26_06045 [Cycloclasticus sp.]
MPQQKTIPVFIDLSSFPTTLINLDTIDKWLSTVFELNISNSFLSNQTSLSKKNSSLYALAYRVQQLSNVFLQLTNIPAFYSSDKIQIIKNRDQPASSSISIPIAFIEKTDLKAYEVAALSAFEIIYWMNSNKLNTSNIQLLYKIVEQKINKPLEPFFTGWKSTLPILRAAYEENVPFIHFGSGAYQLGWGYKARLISNSANEHDSALGAHMVQNKIKAVSTLKMAGLPTTQQSAVNSEKSAYSAASKFDWPVVVKPSSRDRGEGVTTGINDKEKLLSAYKKALKLSPHEPVLVEKMLEGTCHRLFISNYSFLYCARRWPRSVKGDGRRTVAQLISDFNSEENAKAPWLRSTPYPSDSLAKKVMHNNGYSLQSIPSTGELVHLRPFQSDEWGGSADDVSTSVHPDNIAIAIKAARLFGLYNCGVDIISSDISQPWHVNNAAILEVNYTPSLGDSPVSKHYVKPYIKGLVDGNGRIPIHIFMGKKTALGKAQKKHKELLGSDVKCYLTTHDTTLGSLENEIKMPVNGLAKRSFSLLLDRQVEALLVVVQTDECLFESLPFDQVDSFTKADEQLSSWTNSNAILPSQAGNAVSGLLEQLVMSQPYNT